MGLLDGKAAIVTGSARGIGRATAELFVSEGAKVLINDLDADVAEQTAGEIDGETAVYSGDLTKPGAADELVAAAVEAFGAVDICVNNAGYTWDGVAHRMTDEQFQAMLDIHTVVPFRVARALAPHWREAAKAERGGEKIELGIPEQMRAMASAIIPVGRPATPQEASGPVLFLASPLANYIHGQTLNVTGGMFGGMYT